MPGERCTPVTSCGCEELDLHAVMRACDDGGSVVRTWTLRGMPDMVPANDASWASVWEWRLTMAIDRTDPENSDSRQVLP